MNILVIGSKGFIGSHCFEYFSLKNKVWGVDIIADYVSPNYIQIDPFNAKFKEVFNTLQFDWCINCSGAASVPASFQNPAEDFELNTVNVSRILEAIRLTQPKCKFINLSSAAVYGDPAVLPVQETADLVPLSPYGIHKKIAEEVVKEYSKFYGLKTCSIRLFSVYGPRLRKQLFWDIHQKVSESDNISLWGTGKESRDFLYIDDVVKAIEVVFRNAKFAGENVNIASGIETKIEDALSLFQKVYYKKFLFLFGGQVRFGDPINWQADITQATLMGFKPTIGLKEGLTRYIEWIKKEKE